MKILTITNNYGANGAAAMLRNIAKYWTAHLGWNVDAMATSMVSDSDKQLIESAGMHLIGESVDLRAYDVVLINTLVDLHWIEKIPTQVRVVVWAHEGESMLFGVDWSAQQWFNKLSRARMLIFQTAWQTQSVYKSYLWKIPSKRIKIIPNGIFPIEHPGRPQKEPSTKFKVVSVGSVYPRKRPLDLAKAIVNLNKKLDITCDFIGDKQHFSMLGEDALEIASRNPEILHWLGELHGDILHKKISDADIFCHPAGDESFGLAPLEAALLGLPVILANLECYGHVGWVAEENCLMFPKGDVSALEDQIERLATRPDLFKRLTANGRLLAKNMEWDVFCSNMTAAMGQACRI